jgi:uncharacterized membrane protein
MKTNNKTGNNARIWLLIIISLTVIVTEVFFWMNAHARGDTGGAISGALIAVVIIAFSIIALLRWNKDIKAGYPLEDERSRRVKEKASSSAFYISLYMLLLIGLLSDHIIKFRDPSQVITTSVGGMALLFAACWLFFNRREV